MNFRLYILVKVSFIFYVVDNDYFFMHVNAMVGPNIRHPNPNEYLYVVSIVRVDSENTTQTEKFCIGTLVTRKDILTAEHCLVDEALAHLAIIAGSIDFRAGTRYSLFWWLTYEYWFIQFQIPFEHNINDIAMLRVRNYSMKLL
jgi:hypothetical protein